MTKPRVFVTRIIPDKGLRLVQESCDADVWTDELPPTREVLLAHVAGVDGLLSLLTDRIDGEVMDAAGPGLKVISNHAVGFDNIDVPAATARGIPVGNTPGILTDATADFAFALLMAAARRVAEGERFVRGGQVGDLGAVAAVGTRRARRHPGSHRLRADRTSDGPPRGRFRYACPLLRSLRARRRFLSYAPAQWT